MKVDDVGSGCPIFRATRFTLKTLDKITNKKSTMCKYNIEILKVYKSKINLANLNYKGNKKCPN